MKFFETIKQNLAMCLYYPNRMRIFDVRRLVVCCVGFMVVVSHFLFFFYEADDVAKYVNSAYFSTTMLGIFLSFLHTTTKTATIFVLIDVDIGGIIKSRLKYPASRAIYIKTHRLVEKFSKIMYFVIVKMTVPGFVIPKAILCFFIYFNTDLGADAFELPLPMWFPFDWKNPFGFFLAIFLQFGMLFFGSRYLGCILTLVFGEFMFSISFANDMVIGLQSINKCALAKKSEANILERFNEIIVMHTSEKQLINHLTEVCQPTIAILFSGSVIAICAAMLLFQVTMSSNEMNTVLILVSFVYGFWAVFMVFFACETGQRMSYAYIRLDNKINQMDWMFLPMRIQRMLPTIMANMQKPLEVVCFGSTTCSRETFKRVANSGYKFFMMIRKFYG